MATKRKKACSVKNVTKRIKIGSKALDAKGIDVGGVGKISTIEYPETNFRSLGDLGKW